MSFLLFCLGMPAAQSVSYGTELKYKSVDWQISSRSVWKAGTISAIGCSKKFRRVSSVGSQILSRAKGHWWKWPFGFSGPPLQQVLYVLGIHIGESSRQALRGADPESC
jgi:hypothetical protein